MAGVPNEAMVNAMALDAMRAQFENQAAFHAGVHIPPPPQEEGLGSLAALMAQVQGQNSASAGLAAVLNQGLPPLPTLPPLPGLLQTLPGAQGPATAPGGLLGGGGGEGGGSALTALLGQRPVPVVPEPMQPSWQQQHQQQQAQQEEQRHRQQMREESRSAAASSAMEAAAAEEARKHARAKEKAALLEQAAKLKCHLHNKAKNSCKFCKRYQEAIAKAEAAGQAGGRSGSSAQGVPGSYEELRHVQNLVEIASPKTFGFSPLLQSHIVESKYYREVLTKDSFDDICKEIYQYADSVDPYMTNTVGSTMPSSAFCCLYRLFTMGLDTQQLRRLVENADSPYIRCIGFLFIRFGLPPEHLWPWLGEFVLDTEEFTPSKSSDFQTTIGEFVEGLLAEDKYYTTVLPRLPLGLRRQIEAKLAPVPQYRKRTRANLELLEVYRREGSKVEVNPAGEWMAGVTLELNESAPSRIKAVVRLRDGTEETVPIGKMILVDTRYPSVGGGGSASSRGRGRSRSRSPRNTDWSRDKGRSDQEMIDEMRSRDKDRAVCTSGKDYARKPIGFKKACALPREQGQASYRLMEEETFVSDRGVRRRQSPDRQQESSIRKAPSAEHQARMKEVFEKYGMSAKAQSSSSHTDIDESAVLRFG